MPSSASESIPYLIECIRKNRPQLESVLDVGIGFGKNGFLLREYLEAKEWHIYQPKDWKLQITGVDIYEGYISDLQRILYNKIIVGDIVEVLPKLDHFDLAILSDVLEHFIKDDGFKLLHNLFEHVEDIVIATPLGFHEHHATGDNPNEEHRSGWTLDDFKSFEIVESVIINRIRKSDKILFVYLRKHQ